MRISLLREFQVLVKWMNARRAAEELHVSPSCLSKHIVELERETGLALIDRDDPNKILLTRVGQEFASEASYILSSYDAAITACRALQKRPNKILRIQEMMQNDAMVSIYALASAYAKEMGGVDVRYSMLGGTSVEGMLASSEDLDVRIQMRFDESGTYAEEMLEHNILEVPLLTEPTVVWGSKSNQRFALLDGGVSFEQMSKFPIVTIAGKMTDYFGEALADLFEARGAVPRFKASYSALSFSSYFLEDFGDGLFYATRAMLNDARIRSRSDLRSIVLEDPCFRVTTFLCAEVDNKLATDFLSFVRDRHTAN